MVESAWLGWTSKSSCVLKLNHLVLCSIVVSLNYSSPSLLLFVFLLPNGWMVQMFIVTFFGRDHWMMYKQEKVCALSMSCFIRSVRLCPYASVISIVIIRNRSVGKWLFVFLGVVRVVHAIENPVVAIDDEVLILDHLHLVVSLIDRQSNPLNLFFSP